MPIDFPDLESLINASKVWKFRMPNENEGEGEYREALANFVQDKDLIESMEIRTSRGWNRFTPTENLDLILRSGIRNLK